MLAVFTYAVYTPRLVSAEALAFTVERGESLRQIGERLAAERIISEPLFFYLYAVKRGITQDLKAGEYVLPPTVSLAQVAMMMALGQSASPEVTVTIPEGFTLSQIAARLKAAGLPGDAVAGQTINADWQTALPLLKAVAAGSSLEGYLFPDTYRFKKDAAPADIIGRLLANFTTRFASLTPGQAPSRPADLPSIITLASILEREVRSSEDKKLVAGILLKRLAAGMPLQADATVLYAQIQTGVAKPTFDANFDSPYNTYKHRGLPPGPIANPGLESIAAALAPAESPYWYYLSAPDGTTIFSKTFEEHLKAKQKYL